MKSAVCIAMLLQYDFTAAAEWLACKSRRGKKVAANISLASLKSEVTKYFLEQPFGELVHWTDLATTPLPRNSLAPAVQWSEAERLKRYVRKVNLDCGAPVPSCELTRCDNGQVAEYELAPLSPLVSPVVRPMGKSCALSGDSVTEHESCSSGLQNLWDRRRRESRLDESMPALIQYDSPPSLPIPLLPFFFIRF